MNQRINKLRKHSRLIYILYAFYNIFYHIFFLKIINLSKILLYVRKYCFYWIKLRSTDNIKNGLIKVLL